jgi:hypothetical protein
MATFGARWGLPARIECVYAVTAIYAAGVWLAVATALGPFAAPLPQALAIGALSLSMPWWAHRRRRARVRVERKLRAGLLDGLVRLAQDRDDVADPGQLRRRLLGDNPGDARAHHH